MANTITFTATREININGFSHFTIECERACTCRAITCPVCEIYEFFEGKEWGETLKELKLRVSTCRKLRITGYMNDTPGVKDEFVVTDTKSL